jgi:hypothetical protein
MARKASSMGSPLGALYQSARRVEVDLPHPYQAYAVTARINFTLDRLQNHRCRDRTHHPILGLWPAPQCRNRRRALFTQPGEHGLTPSVVVGRITARNATPYARKAEAGYNSGSRHELSGLSRSDRKWSRTALTLARSLPALTLGAYFQWVTECSHICQCIAQFISCRDPICSE